MTTQQQPSEEQVSFQPCETRFCTYCRVEKTASEFVKVVVGRGGKLTKYKCRKCVRNAGLPRKVREELGKQMSEMNKSTASSRAKFERALRKD